MASAAPPIDASRVRFILRKLHSLSGVVPLGGFLAMHLWTNASAFGGQGPFDDAVQHIQDIPALWALELFGIALPLAFHAAYGIAVAREGESNLSRYTTGANFRYVMQRATGVVALLFIALHLYELRVQKLLYGMSHRSFYTTLSAHLSATSFGVPVAALAYLVGIAACAFHLANGLVGFCQSWGLVTSRGGLRRAAYASGALGTALFGLGFLTVFHFTTGTTWAASPSPSHDGGAQCAPQPAE